MAIGTNDNEKHGSFWIATAEIQQGPGNPFYQKLQKILKQYQFDRFCEEQCEPYYAEKMGRPSIPPGVYFRMLMIGYFEGIGSERAIAWRCADSLSLRRFLDYEITDSTPDHSSLCRIRQRLPIEVYREVFRKILEILRAEGLLRGKTLGIDASTIEANAAMRSIIRKIDGKSYEQFLQALAKESGIDNPTRDDLAKIDRNRKDKSCSNKDWENPNDKDARVTKMKDGRTHLAYKTEHAIDLDTGALVGAAIHYADQGDTETLWGTLAETVENLAELDEDDPEIVTECIADRGYHSGPVLKELGDVGIRPYIPEPDRGRRRWKRPGQKRPTEQKILEREALYSNRRRVKGNRSKRLQRKRSELLERSFVHLLDTGGMRRAWLRGLENVWKRYLIHAGAFNLSLVMRHLYKFGTPRGMWGLIRRLFVRIVHQLSLYRRLFHPEATWEKFPDDCLTISV